MNGKSKCRILKEIRRQIAQNNSIEYVTSECKHQGDCAGTCPKCEAELRYLEEELKKRQRAGKTAAIAGIAAALMVTASGCDLDDIFRSQTAGDPAVDFPSEVSQTYETTQGIPIAPEESDGTQ